MKIRKKIDEWMKTAAPEVRLPGMAVIGFTYAKIDLVGNL